MTWHLLERPGPPVEAVVFDLDDTLFPQQSWLDGACDAAAARAAELGVDAPALRVALRRMLAGGSDKGRTIDRALESIGADAPVEPLVEAFLAYSPARLDPYPGVEESLRRFATVVPLALVSDGDPRGQRAKLAATGLAACFKVVVLSDDLGREHRKPDPLPFRTAVEALGVTAGATVSVGDRPDKDVLGATRAGLRAVRVRSGEYAGAPDLPGTWAVCDTLAEAVELLSGLAVAGPVPSP